MTVAVYVFFAMDRWQESCLKALWGIFDKHWRCGSSAGGSSAPPEAPSTSETATPSRTPSSSATSRESICVDEVEGADLPEIPTTSSSPNPGRALLDQRIEELRRGGKTRVCSSSSRVLPSAFISTNSLLLSQFVGVSSASNKERVANNHNGHNLVSFSLIFCCCLWTFET